MERCVDDSLLHDEDIETHWWRTIDFLELCGRAGIVLNPEKFQFCQETVEFAGLEVTMEGVRALWAWELRCTGCGAVLPTPELPNPSRELGNCVDCGSELGLRRKMD